MGRSLEVPITPAVLDWAIRESGYTPSQVAEAAGVDPQELGVWLNGEGRPGLTAVRALARVLKRPIAAFLLPAAPATADPPVRFRHLPGAAKRPLTPVERRYIRKATRLQRMTASLAEELGESRPALPSVSLDADPVAAAGQLRAQLGVPVDEQLRWRSASAAFDGWRAAVERLGVLVLLFPLGEGNCRGFSLGGGHAPLIAVNTAWNDEARAFTLFHEIGHLVTRTSSACATAPPASVAGAWDPAERWCERFAAAVLVPEQAARDLLAARWSEATTSARFADIRWLAGRLHTSLRATALRLIDLGLASWDTYRQLPPVVDAKRGGGGGAGRDRLEVQTDRLGDRVIDLFRRAVAADAISRSEALTYLDTPDAALDSVHR